MKGFNFNFIDGTQGEDNKGNGQVQALHTIVSIGDVVRENGNGTKSVTGTITNAEGQRRSIIMYVEHLPYLGMKPGDREVNVEMPVLVTKLPKRDGDTVNSLLVTTVLAGGNSTTTADEVDAFDAMFGGAKDVADKANVPEGAEA